MHFTLLVMEYGVLFISWPKSAVYFLPTFVPWGRVGHVSFLQPPGHVMLSHITPSHCPSVPSRTSRSDVSLMDQRHQTTTWNREQRTAAVLKSCTQAFRVNISSSFSLEVLLFLQVHNVLINRSFLVHPISVRCPASQHSVFFLNTTLPFSL